MIFIESRLVEDLLCSHLFGLIFLFVGDDFGMAEEVSEWQQLVGGTPWFFIEKGEEWEQFTPQTA